MKRFFSTALCLTMLAAGMVSCNNEEEVFQSEKQDRIELSSSCPGGGDDDDPIIQTGVVNSNNDPQENATIDLYEKGTSTPYVSTITDGNGEACFNVIDGDYFMVTDHINFSPDTTDDFTLTGDTTITIVLNP